MMNGIVVSVNHVLDIVALGGAVADWLERAGGEIFTDIGVMAAKGVEHHEQWFIRILFQQGVELVIAQGYCIRFTRRGAVFATPDTEWLADSEQASASMTNILQLGHSLVAEFE